jgi:hypothetical protein
VQVHFVYGVGGMASWTVGMTLLWVLGTALVAAMVIIGMHAARRRDE